MNEGEFEIRFNSLCFAVFNTAQGKELMKYLDEMMRMPVADPTLNANHAYHREGQNDIIRRFRIGMANHNQHKQEGENDRSSTSGK